MEGEVNTMPISQASQVVNTEGSHPESRLKHSRTKYSGTFASVRTPLARIFGFCAAKYFFAHNFARQHKLWMLPQHRNDFVDLCFHILLELVLGHGPDHGLALGLGHPASLSWGVSNMAATAGSQGGQGRANTLHARGGENLSDWSLSNKGNDDGE
jgi:hypothetical protein